MASFEEYPLRYHNNIYEKDEDLTWCNEQLAGTSTISNKTPDSSEDVFIKKYVGTGVAVVSLIAENLLCHPFIVLRRQCQVHYNSSATHIIPVTLLPVICHLHQHQGITTLWKGLGSTLLIRGMTLGVEDVISKVTPWPKEISWYSSLKQCIQHAFLKCVSLAVVTPFYSASLVETVQSDVASETPAILDVFREGFGRLMTWHSGRLLPIYALVLPTVTLGLTKYFCTLTIEGIVSRVMLSRQRNRHVSSGALPRDTAATTSTTNQSQEEIAFNANMVALVVTDILCYPFECILHRLHLQGTRTIVDNLDTGRSVLPILTNYSGAVDCYDSCLKNEGVSGLYKGFGALILQHLAHIAVIRITRFLLLEITTWIRQHQCKPTRLPLNAAVAPSSLNATTPSQQQPLHTSRQTPLISHMSITSDQSYLLP